MAPDLASGRRSVSPDSSGRDSPIPRQWRNHLGGSEPPIKDKTYRRYAAGVDKVLSLFETALEEWADYISFLNRLLKALQARPSAFHAIPSKALVAKRLSQCLNPSLPSGVHQKALEVYQYVFTVIGKDGLSRDLPLYLPGLAPTLSFASLSVRSPFLHLLEQHFLGLDPRSLKPAMKSIILALLPGLEDETSEDFERTLRLVARFKEPIRSANSEPITEHHASGDNFFWQCFFLASITSHGRRAGALAYLVRHLPPLGAASPAGLSEASSGAEDALRTRLVSIFTSPEPGLLVRCFASGLMDDQLLIQRGFLDLLVTHLPLNSPVLQKGAKTSDLELLLKAATGVVIRRDMSLNRRLWSWLLGPEPSASDNDQSADTSAASPDRQNAHMALRTSFFEEYGLQPLIRALLEMIRDGARSKTAERARPYRICLSLMDRWEIGGLVVPEIFLPVVKSVQAFEPDASSKAEFNEVLRSASFFFDGIESGLIYGELVGLLAQAMVPGPQKASERQGKLELVDFILTRFNVREEEMITIHAPLSCLAALAMLEDCRSRPSPQGAAALWAPQLTESVLKIMSTLLELVPERAFPAKSRAASTPKPLQLSSMETLKKIRGFYVQEQGNIDASPLPFTAVENGELLLQKSLDLVCNEEHGAGVAGDLSARVRILIQALTRVPESYALDQGRLLQMLSHKLDVDVPLPFAQFSSTLQLLIHLYVSERINSHDFSSLISTLVRHAWFYLSAPEPRYHVETVRCLWQLQTVLTPTNRDIEAALCGLLVDQRATGDQLFQPADVARTFGTLWSHTLQDNPSDRRGTRTPMVEHRSAPRLAGMDNYELMLTQPLFLVLDALLDERTQLYMTVKSWLTSMIGIDRLFLVFVTKLSEIPFLATVKTHPGGQVIGKTSTTFTEEDDLDLCLYYLRTLNHVLRCSGEISWAILSSKHLSFEGSQIIMSSGAVENDMTMQDFFVHVCVRCIMGDPPSSASSDLDQRVTQLHRFALTILHHFFLGQHASTLSELHLEEILLDRLSVSINSSDPYVQVLLLDVVYDALKLKQARPTDDPASPTDEKRAVSIDRARNSRPSLSLNDRRPPSYSPPSQLIKCLQAGLSSTRSRPVLDSWVAFLADCLPFYADSIFQVLIPLIETLCSQVDNVFTSLCQVFRPDGDRPGLDAGTPESTLIYMLNGLEQVLGRAHDQLLAEEARAQLTKSPDQPQSLFGSMVSGVFQSDPSHSRSATANDRLTVHLAFQDAVRICFKIWAWGQGDDVLKMDASSIASFSYTSLRMRNRARRLLEHLFNAETLECLETVIDIWRSSSTTTEHLNVFNFLSALDASRPRHAIPALFNSIYSRTNPTALEPSRKSTMTISLADSDLVVFLVEYARSLDDDAMDEIWQDCMTFLKDILNNPFPHRQTLPSLLNFAAILGQKVDNTNFGEQKKMRRELGDIFLRLLTALFTTRPMTFSEVSRPSLQVDRHQDEDSKQASSFDQAFDRSSDVVLILASVVPCLPQILIEPDRVLSAAGTISSSVIVPTIRSKIFPETVSSSTMKLLHELSRLQNNQKTWKRDVGEAFNDPRFFGMDPTFVKEDWFPLLRQWTVADKDKMPEIVGRISAPSTAGIVFGVGATSARLEADRKTQLNLRRIATLVLASGEDAFAAELPTIFDKLVELLSSTSTSSPSSTTRADVLLVVRSLALKISPIHLALLWPVVNAEMHAAMSAVVAPDHSVASDMFTNGTILQACKLLDVLICLAPDDFQLHEWLFISDTIDAVYRSSSSQPIALVDELSEELGNAASHALPQADAAAHLVASGSQRRPLLGPGGINDDVGLERKDELVAKVLRPFFGQLSIFAFESTYSMAGVDRDICFQALLRDIFDERTIAKAL